MSVRLLLLLLLLLCDAYAHAARSTTNHHQLTHALLTSIDERLRGVEAAVVGERHARKLDALDARLDRLEAALAARLDGIDGNISVRHFKAELDADRLAKKTDAVYERLHRRLQRVEAQIDAGERRIAEKLEATLKNFERPTSDEEEAAAVVVEVLDAVDEAKGALHAAVENATRATEARFAELQTRLAPDALFAHLRRLEAIANATRHEQQNAARGLVVMVGRLGGKGGGGGGDAPTDCAAGAHLKDVARKIDARLDALAAQQALFADGCHRIQSDEPQLESKIGEILEKIIDVFEKESAIETKDIQNIEQLIRTHDASVQRSLRATAHDIAALPPKAEAHRSALAARLDDVAGLVETLRAETAQRVGRVGERLDALEAAATIRRSDGALDEAALDAAIREIFAAPNVTFADGDDRASPPPLDLRAPIDCASNDVIACAFEAAGAAPRTEDELLATTTQAEIA